MYVASPMDTPPATWGDRATYRGRHQLSLGRNDLARFGVAGLRPSATLKARPTRRRVRPLLLLAIALPFRLGGVPCPANPASSSRMAFGPTDPASARSSSCWSPTAMK